MVVHVRVECRALANLPPDKQNWNDWKDRNVMPFYDLRCPECDKEYNISASMTEKSEKRIPCPDCGSFELETVFKGSPAYIKSKGPATCPNRHVCGSGCCHG